MLVNDVSLSNKLWADKTVGSVSDTLQSARSIVTLLCFCQTQPRA